MPEVVMFIAFTTAWCNPCKHLKADFANDPSIQLLDVAENQELADSYEVSAYPTVIALYEGQEVGRTVGYNNKPELTAWMERVRKRNE